MRRWLSLPFHQMLVAGLFVIAPVLSAKIAHVGSLNFTVGILAIALVYVVMDVINELWGRQEANRTIVTSTVVRIMLYLSLVPIALALPTSHAPDGYYDTIHSIARVFIAGELAILLGNLVFDIPFFAWLKEQHPRGGFFARTNITNIVSTILSTAIFVTIAFFGVKPLGSIIVGQVVARLVLSLGLSPFSTLYVRWLRGEPDR